MQVTSWAPVGDGSQVRGSPGSQDLAGLPYQCIALGVCRTLQMIAVHRLHWSLSSQILAMWIPLRLMGQPQHWSLLACSSRSISWWTLASTGRGSCEPGVKTAASSCSWLELLGAWLLPGRRSEGNPRPTLSQRVKICQQDHLFPCKNLYSGSVFFFFLPNPAASQGSSWTSKGLQAS